MHESHRGRHGPEPRAFAGAGRTRGGPHGFDPRGFDRPFFGRHLHDQLGWALSRGFGGGRRAVRRGDVRSAVLGVLNEQPAHGYQVISELETRSGGRWRPSAGSIYPTLQQLQDEGLVRSTEVDGRRTYELTDAGREEAAASAAGRPSWDEPGDELLDLRRLSMQVVAASMQVSQVGTSATAEAARDILVDARRRLYRLLAEDEPTSGSETSGQEPQQGI